VRDSLTGAGRGRLIGRWVTDSVVGPLEEKMEGCFETLEFYVSADDSVSWADVATSRVGDGSREFKRDERVAEAVEVIDVQARYTDFVIWWAEPSRDCREVLLEMAAREDDGFGGVEISFTEGWY